MPLTNAPDSSPRTNKTLAVFPGQGSQYVGMAASFYQDFKSTRELFEEASDAISTNLKKLCFDGPESDLTLTANTQPCLLLASTCAFRVAQETHGFTPDLVAGHSLGEYTSLVVAGVIPFSTAVRWVRARGIAMQEAVPVGAGGMAAILAASDEDVLRICERATHLARERASENSAYESGDSIESVEPANYNCPGQVVVAGTRLALEVLKEAAASLSPSVRCRIVPLSVSAPFHSRLMAPARNVMTKLFDKEKAVFQNTTTLSIPTIPNRTARMTREGSAIPQLLSEQIDHPVLWKQSILEASHHGIVRAIEFGPGKVLQGLIQKTIDTAGQSWKIQGISNVEELKSVFETT